MNPRLKISHEGAARVRHFQHEMMHGHVTVHRLAACSSFDNNERHVTAFRRVSEPAYIRSCDKSYLIVLRRRRRNSIPSIAQAWSGVDQMLRARLRKCYPKRRNLFTVELGEVRKFAPSHRHLSPGHLPPSTIGPGLRLR